MVRIIKNDLENHYKLYDINDGIKFNLNQVKYESKIAHSKYLKHFKEQNESSTWGYKYYNLFSLTAGSTQFYNIFQYIKEASLDYLSGKAENLFMESWINYHKPEEILDWHDHKNYLCHGYLSIDPKNSTTEFENYKIENKSGQIYIGPSDRLHRVVLNEPFNGVRITIAFNITDLETIKNQSELNFSLIPI